MARVPGVFQGPDTDSYHTRGWLSDAVHFNQDGLDAHARGWAAVLNDRIAGAAPGKERTRTGRKNPGRHAIQRVPSGERPPPGA